MSKYTSFQREIFSAADGLGLKGAKRKQFLRDCYIAEEHRKKAEEDYYFKPSQVRVRVEPDPELEAQLDALYSEE